MEAMVPGDRPEKPDVDSAPVDHETAAQMRATNKKASDEIRGPGTHRLEQICLGGRDRLPSRFEVSAPEAPLSRETRVSAPVSGHAIPQVVEETALQTGGETSCTVPGPAVPPAHGSEEDVNPRKSVTVQDTAEVIGEAYPDDEAPQSPSAATDSTSDSGGLADLSGSGAHSYRHYRVGRDVVLRLEYISPEDTKVSTCMPLMQSCLSIIPGQHTQHVSCQYNSLHLLKALQRSCSARTYDHPSIEVCHVVTCCFKGRACCRLPSFSCGSLSCVGWRWFLKSS